MPQVPVDMMMPAGWQFYLTIVFIGFGLASYAYAASLSLRLRDPMPLLVVAGGSIAVLGEAPVDILGLCYWAEQGQWTLYEAFGRRIPYITLGAYTTYFGGVVLMTIRQFEKGISYRNLWKWFSIWMVFEWAWEPIPIHFGVWAYYGDQPFRFLGFPMWWPPVNTAGAYTAALLIYRLRPQLKGAGLLLILFMPLSGDMMGNAAVAWPVWIAMNTDLGYAATVPAGVLTLILCAAAIHFIARDVCRDDAKQNNISSDRAGAIRA